MCVRACSSPDRGRDCSPSIPSALSGPSRTGAVRADRLRCWSKGSAERVGSFVAASVPGVRICVGDAQDEAVEAAVANVHQAAGASPAAGTTVDGHRLNCLRGLPQELRRGVDVIAAVPPYVPDTASDFLPRDAVDFEPSSALFGWPYGLDLVRILIDESVDWLRPEGTLLIELGREQAPTALAHAAGRGLAGQGRLGEDEQTVVVELRQA